MIYLDNAATTMHKPQTVIDAVAQALCSLGNAGRGATSGAYHPRLSRHACALAGLPAGRSCLLYAQLHRGAQYRH